MMISDRLGPMPGTAARCALFILSQLIGQAAHVGGGASLLTGLTISDFFGTVLRTGSLAAVATLASASAAAVPEVAITSATSGLPSLLFRRVPSSRSMYLLQAGDVFLAREDPA